MHKYLKREKDANMPKRPPTPFFRFMEIFRKEFNKNSPNYKRVAVMSRSGYSNSDDENHPYDEIQENGNFENSELRKRKGCGFNKAKWGKFGKEEIKFTNDGLCIVSKDAQLSRYLGSLARNYNLLPLSPTDWRSHKDVDVERIWKIISDTIDWQPEDIPRMSTIRHVLLKRLSKRIRNNRADLKMKYYTPNIGSPSRFSCGDDRVDSEQWWEMVNYWDNDPKNKIKVEKNIENRKKLRISYMGGTKSFIRHRAEFREKHGHDADPIEAFDLFHKRKDEQNNWVDDASKQIRVNNENIKKETEEVDFKTNLYNHLDRLEKIISLPLETMLQSSHLLQLQNILKQVKSLPLVDARLHEWCNTFLEVTTVMPKQRIGIQKVLMETEAKAQAIIQLQKEAAHIKNSTLQDVPVEKEYLTSIKCVEGKIENLKRELAEVEAERALLLQLGEGLATAKYQRVKSARMVHHDLALLIEQQAAIDKIILDGRNAVKNIDNHLDALIVQFSVLKNAC